MLKEKLLEFKDVFKDYTRREFVFLISSFVCIFCITAEFAISRPASNSIFLTLFTVKMLPYVWFAIVPLNFLIVSLYNRYLPSLGCLKIFLITITAIIVCNVFAGFYMSQIPSLSFFHNAWKEIYVLLLFQQLWSVIHATINSSKAKYLYGVIFGAGGVGGAIGGIISATCAVKLGSQNLLLVSVPFCLILAVSYCIMLKSSGFLENSKVIQGERPASIWEGMKLIRTSRFLIYLLLIVIFMQFSSTLIDYQFNTFLQREYPEQDLRTQFFGKIVSFINLASLALQFIGSFILVHLFGLRNSHFMIPLILMGNGIGLLFFPVFEMVSYTYATIKSFEYSLFGIIKEMLYIPLKVSEKFQAKSVIDVFAYRSAKALGSFVILVLQAEALHYLTYSTLVIFFCWFIIVALLFKHYEKVRE